MENKIPNLSQFTGTEGYTYLNFLKNLKFTDGWVYLTKEANCYWLADIMASVQHLPKIKQDAEFIIWRIDVTGSSAIVSAYSDCEEDGSYLQKSLLYHQKINYTDFPEGTFEWYQCDDVILLKGEY